jgi:hypothetical protein
VAQGNGLQIRKIVGSNPTFTSRAFSICVKQVGIRSGRQARTQALKTP